MRGSSGVSTKAVDRGGGVCGGGDSMGAKTGGAWVIGRGKRAGVHRGRGQRLHGH